MAQVAEKQSEYYTHEAYFELEKELGQKFEYVAGEVYAMTGGSVNHGLIGGNTVTALNNTLRDKPCTVFNSDVKLRIDSVDSFFYPDAMVLCEKGFIGTDYVSLPEIIIEVLSPTTEDYDHGKKFALYRQIETLQTYIMLHQTKPMAEFYQRQKDNSWLLREIEGLDSIIEINADLQLPLNEFYRQVSFPEK